MNRSQNFFRRTMAIVLAVTVICSQSLLTGSALAQTAPPEQLVSGELSITGNVTINGARAMAGDTVTNDTILKTDCNSTAAVNLGKLGKVEILPGTEIVMSLSGGTIGGNLRSGNVVVSAPTGVEISVVTAEGIVTTAGKEVSVISVDLTLGNTRVVSKRSDAKVTSGSKVEYVSSGQEVAVGTQNPNTGTRCARLGVGGVGPGGASAGVPTFLSGGALAALIIAGVGGTVAAVVAASQSDSISPGQIFVSTYTP